jgi:hypothetical protein
MITIISVYTNNEIFCENGFMENIIFFLNPSKITAHKKEVATLESPLSTTTYSQITDPHLEKMQIPFLHEVELMSLFFSIKTSRLQQHCRDIYNC